MTVDERAKRTVGERVRYVQRKLGRYARPHRPWLIRGSEAALLVVLVRLAFPWPLRGVMELALPGRAHGEGVLRFIPSLGPPLLWLGGAFVALACIQGFAEYVQRVSFAQFATRSVHDARAGRIKRLLKGSARSGNGKTGDMIARVVGDSARIKAGMKGALIHITQNGLYLIGVVAMLLAISRRLGTVFLLGACAVVLISLRGAASLSRVALAHRKKEGELAEVMHVMLAPDRGTHDPVATRKAKKKARKHAQKLKGTNDASGRKDVEISRIEGRTVWMTHVVLALTTAVVVSLGFQEVSAGRLSPAALFTAIAYLLMIHNPATRMSRQAARLGKILASADRLARVKGSRTDPHATPAGSDAQDDAWPAMRPWDLD